MIVYKWLQSGNTSLHFNSEVGDFTRPTFCWRAAGKWWLLRREIPVFSKDEPLTRPKHMYTTVTLGWCVFMCVAGAVVDGCITIITEEEMNFWGRICFRFITNSESKYEMGGLFMSCQHLMLFQLYQMSLILGFGELYVSLFSYSQLFKININYMPVVFILIYLM